MSTFQFQYKEEDHLQFQLFRASISESIQKKRSVNKYYIPFFYLAGGVLMFLLELYYMSGTAVILSILWFLLYPSYEGKRYIKHFSKFIEENYAENLKYEVVLHLNLKEVLIESYAGNTEMKNEQIERCDEISTAYLVKYKTGVTLILPKDRMDKSLVEEWLLQMKASHGLVWEKSLDWEWH